MIPITVLPIIYVLKLENDKFYIGITYNLNFRFAQHLAGEGSNWTALHKPIKIHEGDIKVSIIQHLQKMKRLLNIFDSLVLIMFEEVRGVD